VEGTGVSEQLTALVTDRVEASLKLQRTLLEPRRRALIVDAALTVADSLRAGGKVLLFGNGGSAADAQHIAAELVGRYLRERAALPAIALTDNGSIITAVANDYDYDDVFGRQLEALARPHDVVCGFSTSGGSRNVVAALRAAQRRGATTVLFGGGGGGAAKEFADRVLLSPSKHTPRIQEMHTLMLHAISEVVDAWAAGTETDVATPAAGTHSRSTQAVDAGAASGVQA